MQEPYAFVPCGWHSSYLLCSQSHNFVSPCGMKQVVPYLTQLNVQPMDLRSRKPPLIVRTAGIILGAGGFVGNRQIDSTYVASVHPPNKEEIGRANHFFPPPSPDCKLRSYVTKPSS